MTPDELFAKYDALPVQEKKKIAAAARKQSPTWEQAAQLEILGLLYWQENKVRICREANMPEFAASSFYDIPEALRVQMSKQLIHEVALTHAGMEQAIKLAILEEYFNARESDNPKGATKANGNSGGAG